jgi:hypothetical protein
MKMPARRWIRPVALAVACFVVLNVLALPGPKTIRQFDGVGHEGYAASHPEEWKAAVADLITQAQNKHTRNRNLDRNP